MDFYGEFRSELREILSPTNFNIHLKLAFLWIASFFFRFSNLHYFSNFIIYKFKCVIHKEIVLILKYNLDYCLENKPEINNS
jgi:hypothetical protein